MSVINQLTLIDKNLLAAVALPAAGATAYTPVVDLNTNTAGRIGDVELRLFTDVLAGLADGKNMVLTLQESSDNITFTPAADLPSYTFPGAGGVGAPAALVQVKLPIGLKRYIRLRVDVDAAGGALTALFATVCLVF